MQLNQNYKDDLIVEKIYKNSILFKKFFKSVGIST